VRDYIVTKISLDATMMRIVEAVTWVPSIYSLADVGDSLAGRDGPEGMLAPSTVYQGSPTTIESATDVTVEASPAGGGLHIISWGLPTGGADHSPGQGAAGRVFIGPDPAPPPPDDLEPEFAERNLDEGGSPGGSWFPIGDTRGQEIETELLTPGRTYQLAVVLQGFEGIWQQPAEGLVKTITVPEFPPASPPSVRKLVAVAQGKGILLSWQQVDSPLFLYYEVRAGAEWISAHCITRTRDCWYRLEMPMPGLGYMVRARFASGLYSSTIATVAAPSPDFAPDDSCPVLETDLAAFPGTLVDLTIDTAPAPDELRISDDKLEGTWESAEFDNTYSIDALALFRYSTRYDHPVTIQELIDEVGDIGVQSGEAAWWTLAGREPSAMRPGLNLEESIADADGLISLLTEDRRALTYTGEVGQHVRHFLEVKYDAGSYEEWRPERRAHQTIRFRLTLVRRDLDRQIYITSPKVWDYA
jgi:hypothetical protein